MGLKDLQVPQETVEIPGQGSITVRGLSYADLLNLMGRHGDTLANVFQLFADNASSVTAEDFTLMAGDVLLQAPALAADAICVAADEPDAFETALRLPFPLQTEILSKIGKLTFATEDDVKKFLKTVKSLMGIAQVKKD